jgi:hypothetical protein
MNTSKTSWHELQRGMDGRTPPRGDNPLAAPRPNTETPWAWRESALTPGV